jgi:PDZ domain-containing protein
MTLAVSTALLFALAVVAGAVKVPYVALTPGPVVNTLGVTKDDQRIIQVTGRQTYPAKGRLDLTTVSVRGAPGYGALSLVEALRYWVDPEIAVVPREAYYPPGQDREVAEAESTAQMVDSQESAALAAMRLLGEKVTSHVAVVDVVEGGPSAGRLKREDVVDSVDGQPVTSAGDLRAAVMKRRPGDRSRSASPARAPSPRSTSRRPPTPGRQPRDHRGLPRGALPVHDAVRGQDRAGRRHRRSERRPDVRARHRRHRHSR